jgi:hypothetical protein
MQYHITDGINGRLGGSCSVKTRGRKEVRDIGMDGCDLDTLSRQELGGERGKGKLSRRFYIVI